MVSHAQSLGQCRDWLRQNLPGDADGGRRATRSAQAASRGLSTAAIASAENAERYGCACSPTRSRTCRTTSRASSSLRPADGMTADDADKVSLLFSVKNRPGMLFSRARPLSDRGIDPL